MRFLTLAVVPAAFAVSAAKLARENPAIALSAVVVDKRRLGVHVHQDANTLYNYLVKHLLLAEMARHDRVQFRPDERAVPTRSGNSRHSQNLQFVDMVSGAVHAHFEFGEQRNWALLEPHVRLEEMNFE